MKVILFENLLLPEKYLLEVITKDTVKQYENTYNKLIKDYYLMNDENSFLALQKMIVPFFLSLMTFIEHNIFGMSARTNPITNKLATFKKDNLDMDSPIKINIFNSYNNLSQKLGEIFKKYDKIKQDTPQDIPSFLSQILAQKTATEKNLIDSGNKLFALLYSYVGEEGRPDFLAEDTFKRDGVTYTILYYEPDFKEVKIKTDIIATEVERVLLAIKNKKFRDLKATDLNISIDFQDSDEAYFRDEKASGFYQKNNQKISYRDIVSNTDNKWRRKTVAHELGHKYYYNILTPKQRESWDQFFNNSMASLPIRIIASYADDIANKLNQRYHWVKSDLLDEDKTGKHIAEFMRTLKESVTELENGTNYLNLPYTLTLYIKNIMYYLPKDFGNFMKASEKMMQDNRYTLGNILLNVFLQYGKYKREGSNFTPLSFIPIDYHSSVYGQNNSEEHFAETFSSFINDEEVPPFLKEQLNLLCRIP